MSDGIVKFNLRTESEINGRSANCELEFFMKKHIAEFEKIHGMIELD